MSNKKKITLIASIAFLIIFIIGMIILINNNRKSKFDLDKIEKEMLKEYKELDIRTFDQYDISMYFGFDFNEIPSSLFLSDFAEDPEEPKPFSPKILIIIINTKDVDKYYDSLLGFIDLNENNNEDKKIAKLFNKAILKKGENYVYLVLGDNSKEIEKKLLESQE